MTGMFVLFDVDNTLLNTDLAVERMEAQMTATVGREHATRFWELYEEVRAAGDAVNIPDTLELFSLECADVPAVNTMSGLIYGFDFRDYVYEGAFEAIEHAKLMGDVAVLSDGDQLFQRHKISMAGIERAVGGNVMVQKHKELVLKQLRARFPAGHYVMLDDKPGVLARMKRELGTMLTTVQVCQGKYSGAGPAEMEPDMTLGSIGEFVSIDTGRLIPGHS